MEGKEMKKADIGYLTDAPEEYAKGLHGCTTIEQLRTFLAEWEELAPDAIAQFPNVEKDFQRFRRAIGLEFKGKFCGKKNYELFSRLLLPARLFDAAVIAQQYHVPWGCAFKRLEEEKK